MAFQSQSNSARIVFSTDSTVRARGFRLTYTFSVEECGGNLTGPFGCITSPNFPSNYTNGVRCTWVINAPEGYRIHVTFTEFALEKHDECEYDYLELLDGPYASSPSIGKYCGIAQTMAFKLKSNSARIVFSTNSIVSARGFILTYTFSEPVLGSACSADSNCSEVTNAICHNNTCKCSASYTQKVDVCIIGLGNPCADNADCTANVAHSVCANNICACNDGYQHTGMECVVVLFQRMHLRCSCEICDCEKRTFSTGKR
ncbi:deleted in malignant brain tumors 1 protein-like [Dreissena polymorpha]|nr:deleted in malignant brain tumors 1 protein-like [Dreissena polymorpha]